MPLSIQDLIKVVEEARYTTFNVEADSDEAFIDADILLAELRKMEESQGKPCPGTHAGFCPDCH